MTFGSLAVTTTRVRLSVTDAPVKSALRQQLDAARGSEAVIFDGPAADVWQFKPDIAGVYSFDLVEIQEQPASGARFAGDTRGAPNPVVGDRTPVAVYVGERLTMKLGLHPHQCDLMVVVWNETVRATQLSVHGFDSPALLAPSSPAAASAAQDAALGLLLDVLVDKTAAQILDAFVDDYVTVRDAINDHMANGTAHDDADSVNPIGAGWRASTLASAQAAVNELRRAFGAHTRSTSIVIDPIIPTSITVHGAADGDSGYQLNGAGDDRASQYAALADAMVRLAEHKALAGSVHDSADAAAAPTVSPLLAIVARFMTALRLSSPTLPPNRNPGAARLEQFGGFKA